MKTGSYFFLALMLSALSASAHLLAGSLKPSGGETYQVGATMSIEWVASQAHDGRYDVYYSKDGGKTFPVELAGPWQGSKTDNAKNTYLWKIPADAVSSQIRIRICQLYGGHCVQPGTYMMDSPANVIITAASTPIAKENKAKLTEPRLGFSMDEGNLDIRFILAEAQDIALDAYDVSGNWLAHVAGGKLEKGEHRFPLSSDKVDVKSPMVFKLNLGGKEVSSQIWNGSR